MPFLSTPKTRLLGIRISGSRASGVFGGRASGPDGRLPPGDGFNPNANGIVNTIVLQPDGKILMGGYFTQLQPAGNQATQRGYIARLNHDGSVDASFTPSANGVVRTDASSSPTARSSSAASFTTIQATGSGTPRSPATTRPASTPTGRSTRSSIPTRTAWSTPSPTSRTARSSSAARSRRSSPTGSAAPVTRNHIARFNADGTLDTRSTRTPTDRALPGGPVQRPDRRSAAASRPCSPTGPPPDHPQLPRPASTPTGRSTPPLIPRRTAA